MADRSPSGRRGVTSRQLVLIGVLIAVLVAVLVAGRSGSEDSAVDRQQAAVTEGVPGNRPSRVNRPVAISETKLPATAWPDVPLDDVLSHNPFAEFPLPQPAISQQESVLPESEPLLETPAEPQPAEALDAEHPQTAATAMADLRSLRVSMILSNDRKTCAVIGERLVHEGDVIDGMRVVSISPRGVVVERVPTDSSTID